MGKRSSELRNWFDRIDKLVDKYAPSTIYIYPTFAVFEFSYVGDAYRMVAGRTAAPALFEGCSVKHNRTKIAVLGPDARCKR